MAAIAREALLAFTLQDRKPTSVAMLLSVAATLALVTLRSTLDAAWHSHILRVILLFIALGELVGGFTQIVLTRSLIARASRPYHPAHHGLIQDFGFYDLATAAIVVLIALDPQAHSSVLGIVAALYAAHGLAHLLRSRRLLAGGDPDPGADVRQGLPLLVAALGLLLFMP